MEIILEKLFVTHLKRCPEEFKQLFKHVYFQIKKATSLNGIEGIFPLDKTKKHYKVIIDKSRIGLTAEGNKVHIDCFIYNQFYTI